MNENIVNNAGSHLSDASKTEFIGHVISNMNLEDNAECDSDCKSCKMDECECAC